MKRDDNYFNCKIIILIFIVDIDSFRILIIYINLWMAGMKKAPRMAA